MSLMLRAMNKFAQPHPLQLMQLKTLRAFDFYHLCLLMARAC